MSSLSSLNTLHAESDSPSLKLQTKIQARRSPLRASWVQQDEIPNCSPTELRSRRADRKWTSADPALIVDRAGTFHWFQATEGNQVEVKEKHSKRVLYNLDVEENSDTLPDPTRPFEYWKMLLRHAGGSNTNKPIVSIHRPFMLDTLDFVIVYSPTNGPQRDIVQVSGIKNKGVPWSLSWISEDRTARYTWVKSKKGLTTWLCFRSDSQQEVAKWKRPSFLSSNRIGKLIISQECQEDKEMMLATALVVEYWIGA